MSYPEIREDFLMATASVYFTRGMVPTQLELKEDASASGSTSSIY